MRSGAVLGQAAGDVEHDRHELPGRTAAEGALEAVALAELRRPRRGPPGRRAAGRAPGARSGRPSGWGWRGRR